MITLTPCPKSPASDLDKSRSPAETVRLVRERLHALEERGIRILQETKRVDVGRLGIPVFMSVCGETARNVLPTRKQMGKGANADQAEASALMELMERFGFFSFRPRLPEDRPSTFRLTWSEAERRFGDALMPVEDILRSVGDFLSPEAARVALDLLVWDFVPLTDISAAGSGGRELMVPINWFYTLGEFNGSSAGNTAEESLLQGACELVERHVSCRIDRERPVLPTIDSAVLDDPVLAGLVERFHKNGITLVLKDISLDMPVPTVAALAWDPASFPARSEIVFTAGTATSPVKAAIRAVTEVAQLAGDFMTGACYEASGLPKFTALTDTAWLLEGPCVPLSSLPDGSRPDIRDELLLLARGLQKLGIPLYAADTTSPLTRVPSHYSIAPGLAFRERDINASLGLFTGRLLAENEEDTDKARQGLAVLATLYPGAHWEPFFQGLISLREGDADAAVAQFTKALPLQPDDDTRALTAFYLAHTLTRSEQWQEAVPHLDTAVSHGPEVKEYYNLRGVCHFKLGAYEKAGADFLHVVTYLDKGSLTDIANLGFCQARLGNVKEAVHWLTAALELDPGHEKARQVLRELM